MKFGRSYEMLIDGNYGASSAPAAKIDIGFPTTIDFSITHNIFASANAADFSLYNLSATNRSLIAYNQFLKSKAYGVTLYAGYINALDNGDITTGQPAGFFGPTNAYTAPKDELFVNKVAALVKRLTGGVKFGAVIVDKLPDPLPRKQPFNGCVWTELQKLADSIPGGGGHVFIENNVCYMLGQNNVIPDAANNLGTLSSDTGLLGTPRFTGATIMVSCIFEPLLRIGATIQLLSKTNTNANGPCKIVAYTHHGQISAVQSGKLISDITLMQLGTPIGGIQQ